MKCHFTHISPNNPFFSTTSDKLNKADQSDITMSFTIDFAVSFDIVQFEKKWATKVLYNVYLDCHWA